MIVFTTKGSPEVPPSNFQVRNSGSTGRLHPSVRQNLGFARYARRAAIVRTVSNSPQIPAANAVRGMHTPSVEKPME
jgi:hypothetical protein